MSYAD